jgi:hypothetical protein
MVLSLLYCWDKQEIFHDVIYFCPDDEVEFDDKYTSFIIGLKDGTSINVTGVIDFHIAIYDKG